MIKKQIEQKELNLTKAGKIKWRKNFTCQGIKVAIVTDETVVIATESR